MNNIHTRHASLACSALGAAVMDSALGGARRATCWARHAPGLCEGRLWTGCAVACLSLSLALSLALSVARPLPTALIGYRGDFLAGGVILYNYYFNFSPRILRFTGHTTHPWKQEKIPQGANETDFEFRA